jgi:MoxR-like ATPase
LGVSTRGTISTMRVARAYAATEERDHVTPDDVRAVVHDCLRHRVMLTYEASASGLTAHKVVSEVVKVVAVA